jgi:hypothetical protein
MTRHERDLRRTLLVIAAESGARLVTIETTGGGHRRVIYERHGVLLKQAASATLSDRWYGRQKMEADARRLLRRVGIQRKSGIGCYNRGIGSV